MTKISVKYKNGCYYINNEPLGSFCNHEMLFRSIMKIIQEEFALTGIKNGFIITIEQEGTK